MLPDIGVVLEAKFIRDANHAKRVADELRIDFECYHDHPSCGHLLALVWDPERHIADPAQFSNDLSGLRQKNGKSFEVTSKRRSSPRRGCRHCARTIETSPKQKRRAMII